MPRVNLYRNISLSFIVFTVILVLAVFLLFYSSTSVIIVSEEQNINLSFNMEVKSEVDQAQLAEKNVVKGSLVSWDREVVGDFVVLGTKTVSSEFVGKVTIVNNSGRGQTLLKTTQLQSASGVIVRTNRQVTIPAGGQAIVDVYPKDPASFINVDPGNLKIIKLSVNLQDKIYGVSNSQLTNDPREVGVLLASDASRAQKELATMAIEELKDELSDGADKNFIYEVVSSQMSANLGDEVNSFNLALKLNIKTLEVDQGQLFSLLNRKVGQQGLEGFDIGSLNLIDVSFAVVDENFGDSVLVEVDYSFKVKINTDHSFLDRDNLANKTVDEATWYLNDSSLVKEANVYVSPYWKKSLPKDGDKIEIVIH